MAKSKIKTDVKVSDKKMNRQFIEKKLEDTFSDLKSLVGKKKFEQGIKKAGRIFNKDFSKKALENLRKQHEIIHPEEKVQDDTTLLIEELP